MEEATQSKASGVTMRSRAHPFRMTELHATVQCRDAAIASRLVENRVSLDGLRKRLRVGLLLDLEAVETRAQHEHELVTKHLSGRSQFAAIIIALAQKPGLTIRAPVTERW